MIVYGVALLAICTLAGVIIGDFLGVLLGVQSNVGGVGIAMIFLICARLYMHKHGSMSHTTKETELGVSFWGCMYIPIVVAMAAQQNVVTALHGGPVALIGAIGSVLVCGFAITVISRSHKGEPLPAEPIEPLPEKSIELNITAAPVGGR
ncbi:malonate transporter, MadL subunit [Azotobacter beijerinckii]|uniref:Malonate transporter, MadL subunit n=1 Tax=Azotobacter beijerinckii TaxID=170623 RepID=A0A1H9G8N0_9GAMM|nr:malonate transporter subunit MadL [Azotobacter beijerinckii]MDV7211886.1 malonate transporter subunit MadL [Azotobacter beijerinckii]SEI52975.1 malonate transporter, MadL subunit [Azotobacter beijerinckii]SEJ19604.1 malonate transporter, MadL subunit [Azotobacter beijerinckii]SEQ46118.1 malonate transporter, MadL subunit [Azotobacter beijerinckii]